LLRLRRFIHSSLESSPAPLTGRIAGVPQLAHLSLGRRKLVPREWFDQWLEESRSTKG
jgi:hypothetical protein